MRGKTVPILWLVLILLFALPGTTAQTGAEGRVEVQFLEDVVTIRSGENGTVPLHVRAEIECDGVHGPPDAVRFSGRYGVAWHAAGGAYYATRVEPPTVPFQLAEPMLPGAPGPLLYKIDFEATLHITTELAVVEPLEHGVVYSTMGLSSMDGCRATGWSLPPAEDATFHLHVLPPTPSEDEVQAEASPGIDAALTLVVVIVAVALARSKRFV